MFFLIPSNLTRPSILTKNKDEKYHRDFARYCLGQANNQLHNLWLEKIEKNKRFYKGDQWTEDEDVSTFFKDSDNGDRNRLSIVQNVIRPMVEQYRGNAIRMNINFRVKSISPQAINRRETELAKMRHLTKIAKDNPFGPEMKKKFPIGDTEGETSAIFSNIYVDSYVEDMNRLAKFVSERNRFAAKQVTVAINLAFSGLGVMTNFEYAGHQQFRVVPSETFFWDRSAKEPDLTDSAFMGEIQEMFPSEIFEQYPDISDDDRKSIENFSTFYSGLSGNQMPGNVNNTGSISSGKVPVYKVYWQDGQPDEFGYVKDQYGYEYLTKINYTYEGEDKARYTDKDLIKSESDKAKKLYKRWGGKLSGKNYYDTLRMALIIPKEIIGSAEGSANKNEISDIVLDWGISPYQDTEVLEYNTVKYPYKCDTWAYVDGEVLSPIDDAIDPQRFINRVWSISENQMNNMGGTGTVIDQDFLDDPAKTAQDTNQSKTIFVRGKGKGVQNIVGTYDSTRALSNTAGMYNIIEAMKASIKETTGVNDAVQGQATGNGNDQLVGVTQLMIERGSLMQEPFYNALTSVFEQSFNAICTVGKRIYIDNDRNLTIATGDDGAAILRLSKDMKMEDFRTFVKRENSDEMLVNAANQQLLQFKQLMMLDDKRISNLWGRSTPDQVAASLREYAKEKEEIQRMSQKDAAAQEEELTAQAQQEKQQQDEMMQEQVARQDIQNIDDKKAENRKSVIAAISKIAPKNKKAENIIVKEGEKLQAANI